MRTKNFAKIIRIFLAGLTFLGLLSLSGCAVRGGYIGVSDGYYDGYRPARPYNYNYNYNYRPAYPNYYQRGNGYWGGDHWHDHRGYRR